MDYAQGTLLLCPALVITDPANPRKECHSPDYPLQGLPHGWENMAYEDFLIERRKLMAAKIKAAFEILKKAAT